MQELILVGFGGHAKSVIDSVEKSNHFHILGFTDIHNNVEYGNYQYLGNDDVLYDYRRKGVKYAFISLGYMGNNNTRDVLYHKLKQWGYDIPVIIDESAIVAKKVKIGEGSYVGKGCVINANTFIGKMCIINTGAIVEHDNYVCDFSHVAVNSTLCGGVSVGEHSLIGANSTIIQNISIGDHCIVGAGSVVLSNLSSGQKVVGIYSRKNFGGGKSKI